MATAYQGELIVENGDFDLTALRFIVRESDVSFDLTGWDSDGKYFLSGPAIKTPNNAYLSASLPVRYDQFNGDFRASILLTEVRETKTSCHVKGKWMQDGETWNFGGRLSHYKASA